MTLDIPAGFGNITFGYTNDYNSHASSTSIAVGGSFSGSDSIALDVFNGIAGTNIGADLKVGWSLVQLVVEDNLTRTVFDFSSPGTGGGNAVSPQVAGIMKKKSVLRGHKNSGRMYWPAGYFDEGDIDQGGHFIGASRDDYQTQFDAYLAPILDVAGVDGFYILHTDPGDDPTVVIRLDLESLVATQRRRLR